MGRIAFVDLDGCCLSAAYRVQCEGHSVCYFVDSDDPAEVKVGQGIVPKAESLKDVTAFKPDVVVGYQLPEAASELRALGLRVWGSSPSHAELENDRMYAAKVAADAGMSVPITHVFNSMESALRFIDKTDITEWVFKAEGRPETVMSSSTHVAESKDHLRAILDLEGRQNQAKSFVLQERKYGVELSTEGWYDYRVGWLRPFNSTLERKKRDAGDVGPMTGAMGSVVWAWPDTTPRIFTETLAGMTRYLEREKYVGPIDVNTIIDEGGRPWFLEFTPRLGWDAFEALMSGIDVGKLGDFFIALGAGRADTVPVGSGFMVAVRLMIPAIKNIPIIAPWRADPHYFLKNVWHDGKSLRSTGAETDNHFSAIFEVGASGESIGQTAYDVYHNLVPKVLAPDLSFRNDIGIQAGRDIETLEMLGYGVRPMVGGAMPTAARLGNPNESVRLPLTRKARSA